MEERFKFRRVNELTGTLVLVVIAVLIGTVIMSGNSQRWFQSRVSLCLVLPETGAAGIRQGSEIYFLGTLVGSVTDVIVDAAGRMKAQATIRRDFFQFVRSDSSAVVKKKFGVAGDSFFEITRGKGKPLPEKNASIVCNEQVASALDAAIEEIRQETLRVLKKTSTGLDTWTKLGGDLGETQAHLSDLAVRVGNLVAGLEQGQGTAGKLLTDTALADEAQKILAHVQRIAAGVEDGKGTVGRLLTDPGLADEAQKLMTRAHQTLGELQVTATNLSAAVKNVQAGSTRLPEIADAVAAEAKALPGLVLQTQTSMRELERLIEALQRHWLVRKLVNHTNPPSLRALPASEEPNKQPTNSLRSPRELGRRP